ncbi:MAG TPA: aminotransferase class V-fold PLP-dependent enzyme, partial [Ktedonobacterales bacterium]|nr:aminotransferase class V-fold PLP-dependent enzyme [Ktedonobacterales bacterium]
TALALRLVHDAREAENARLTALRDRLIAGLLALPGARLTGHPTDRLPNSASVAFGGVEGESMLLNLDLLGIAASSGSACTTGSVEPSHVLSALGMDAATARGHLRLTLGKSNTEADVDAVLRQLPGILERLRALGTRAEVAPA